MNEGKSGHRCSNRILVAKILHISPFLGPFDFFLKCNIKENIQKLPNIWFFKKVKIKTLLA